MVDKLSLYNPTGHEELIQEKLNEFIEQHNELEKALIEFGYLSYKEEEKEKEKQKEIPLFKRLKTEPKRYLNCWDCTRGVPQSVPHYLPWKYEVGDWYRVSQITCNSHNYIPKGKEFSTRVDTISYYDVNVGDILVFTGEEWINKGQIEGI